MKTLHEYFTEDDGFLAQLSKFKLLNWFEDSKEQLVDEFCWRIVAAVQECNTDEQFTLSVLSKLIGAYRLAHFKLVEAGLILVERQASSRKGLRVKNQAHNHFVPDHFEYNRVRALKNWFYDNWTNPFPSPEVKNQLAAVSGLTVLQVQAWFINWRDRNWKSMKDVLVARRQEHRRTLVAVGQLADAYYVLAKSHKKRVCELLATLAAERPELAEAISKHQVRIPGGQASVSFQDGRRGVNGSALEFVDSGVGYDDSVQLGTMIIDVAAANAVGYQTYKYLPPSRHRGDIDTLDQDDEE